MRPVAFPLLLLFSVAACEPASMVMTGASVISLLQSEQTLGDKALSWALKEDCSIFQIARGEEYCKSRAPALIEKYCYRDLGGVTCYTVPDTRASDSVAVYAFTPPAPELEAPAVASSSSPPKHYSAQRQ